MHTRNRSRLRTRISTFLDVPNPAGNLSTFYSLLLYLYPSISATKIPSEKGPALHTHELAYSLYRKTLRKRWITFSIL